MKNQHAFIEISEVFSQLRSDTNGLSEIQITERIAEKGYNEISHKKIDILRKLLDQYANFLMLLLMFGVIISFLLGEVIDGWVIITILVINGALGTFQEYRAEKLTQILQKHIPQKVRVRRNGIEKTVERRSLVYGDIILLNSGQLVPADARIIKTKGLIVDESILTGESGGVSKSHMVQTSEGNTPATMLFSSTLVIDGQCEAVVVATGGNTEFGQIVALTHHSKKRSSFLLQINQLSDFLFKTTVFIGIVLFFALKIFHPEFGLDHIFLFTVAMAIAIVPEMLPLISTLALTRASLVLVKSGVLIKRLSSIEDMGGVEIICTDKTGTLTKNVISVVDVVAENKQYCLQMSLIASKEIKDTATVFSGSFDVALWKHADVGVQNRVRESKRIYESTFDFDMKWQFSVAKNEEKHTLAVKGAPETVLLRCSMDESKRETILKQIKELSEKGLRTLVIAEKSVKENATYNHDDIREMAYVGHIVFEDPIKESTAETLKRAGELGLEIKILTGDSAEVALHVAQGLGMNIQPSEVFIGSDIENIEEEKRYNAFKYIKIFARVNPKEKYAIIKALSSHHSVMLLGEGVNDAPALKTADVGMVVEEASDIAKESADIVLTQRDLSVIVEAIYLGRQIMNNIGKYILITLTGNFGSLYSLSLISIISKSLPLLPTQVLLENILTDVPMISVVNSPISKSEERRPVKQNIKGICYAAVSLGFATLFVQFLFYKVFSYLPEDLFRTLWLIEIILFEFILIVSLRTNDWFWKAPPLRRQTVIFFLGVVLFTVLMPFVPLLQKAFHLAPYGIKYALPVVGTVLFGFAVVEVMKRFVFSKKFST